MENFAKDQTRRADSLPQAKGKLREKIFASSEVEKYQYQFKIGRKLIHTSFSLFGFVMLFGSIVWKPYVSGALYLIFVLSFLADSLRIFVPYLNRLTYQYLGAFFIKRDETRYSSGTYYLLGASLACLLYSYRIAGMSIIFLGIGDFMASLAGTYLKPIIPFELPYSHKTLIGLLAFITVTTLIGVGAGFPFWACLLSSIGASLAEVYLIQIDDNLSIPLIGGALLTLMLKGSF